MGTELDDLACPVYLALRQRISSGELAPGERLPRYRDLTREFRVSATSVRTAFHRLQTDGYVYREPGRLFWFVKPRSSIVSRREFLSDMVSNTARYGLQMLAVPAAVAVFANIITPSVLSLRGVSNKSKEEKDHPISVSRAALRELWDQALTLNDENVLRVQLLANPEEWSRRYKPVNEAEERGSSTVLSVIQELSRQESKKDLSQEREHFLDEALRLAVEAQSAGAAYYGPLQHFVQLRQAVFWRQRGGPRSAEHERARTILTNIKPKAPGDKLDSAIQLGVLNELSKLRLEAQEWSEFHDDQRTLEKNRQASDTRPTALWQPFYELLELEAEDVRVRGYARVEPDLAYQRQDKARQAIEDIERRFGRRTLLTQKKLLYGVDISLNFSFARILLGSPDPDDRVHGMLQLQQGEARAQADGLSRQARIAQLIREEYVGSVILPPESRGRCDYDRTLTMWEWQKDTGIYVCTKCGRQPIRA